ncbi:MAG: nucleotide exchange factor GrpE [Candidatus Cloacimonas sp.]|nr:nucleotide exchange factor GrpE [Candidatus Cloacimonadota bacterium]
MAKKDKVKNIEIETPSDEAHNETEVLTEEGQLLLQIAVLEKKNAETNDKYMRTLAEFENFRRRSNQERLNWIKNANESLILKLCDILDDFERAFENTPEEDRESPLFTGMEAIKRKFSKILQNEGLEKIEAEDAEFDPMFHEALACPPSEVEKDKIISVIQNGYVLNNKVIRPAKVAVSAGLADE